MLSILPTANYFDQLIVATRRWTTPGISHIAPGTITPASKLWCELAYQPIAHILQVLQSRNPDEPVGKNTKDVPNVPCLEKSTPKGQTTDGNDVPPVHPSVRTYRAYKQQYPDPIIFLRIGDFFETFDDDAKTVSTELDLVLTGKGQGQTRAPMTGVPIHAFDRHQTHLTCKGYSVRAFDTKQAQAKRPKQSLWEFEILDGTTPIAVSYNPNWLNSGGDTVHFEFSSKEAPRQPISCSPTGYHSHFTTPAAVAEYDSPIAYAKAYLEAHRNPHTTPPRRKPQPKTEATTAAEQQQMSLKLAGDASTPEDTHLEDKALRALVPLKCGDIVEVADSLTPKHPHRDAIGKCGRIIKFTDADNTDAVIEFIETGHRCTLPTFCLNRLKRVQLQYLGNSHTLAYATLNGELHGWVGFKTKALHSDWCKRKRDRSAYVKDLEDPKRSFYTDFKWECAVKKPTMKKLKKLAEYNFSHDPGTFFYQQRKAKEATQAELTRQADLRPAPARGILLPGAPVEITTERDDLKGKLATVLVDEWDDGKGKITVCLERGRIVDLSPSEFRAVNTEPEPKQPVAA